MLKKLISSEQYENFLNFHVATRISSNGKVCQKEDVNSFCKSLFKRFVKNLARTFGNQFISHNVHGLIHIADDAFRLGPIESFSAYSFENYNGILKNLARKGNKPLEQIVKRITEIEQQQGNNTSVDKQYTNQFPFFSHPHTDGPLPENVVGDQFKQLAYRNWTFTCKTPNNVAVLNDGTPVIISNFVFCQDKKYIVGKAFEEVLPLFKSPVDSRSIGTYKVSILSDVSSVWTVETIRSKAVKFSYNGKQVISSLSDQEV